MDSTQPALQPSETPRGAATGALLAAPARSALFLDIDGTLLDVAPTPAEVHVPPGLGRTLERLAWALDGALVLSTGRRVSSADQLFAPLRLVTAGVHGTELRTTPHGKIVALLPLLPAELIGAVKEAAAHLSPSIMVEQKGAGIAVHYRSAPEAGAALEQGLHDIVGRWHRYELRGGRRVLEILPRGYSKGTALDRLMRQPPFAGRLPVMIGDDRGDEPALDEARRLGGVGLRVAGEHFAAESADFAGPADVRAWLGTLAAKLEIGRARPSDHWSGA